MTLTAQRRRATPAPTPAVRFLPRPPAPPEPVPGAGLVQVLLPAAGGLGMVLFLLAGRNRLLLMAGVVMLVVTVGGALGTAVASRVGPRRRHREARSDYLDRLAREREQIRDDTRLQRTHDDDVHPDPVALFSRLLADGPLPRPAGEESLVRVGTGPREHPVRLALPDVDTDPASERAMTALAHAHRTLPRSPLVVDLAAGDIAVLGSPADVRAAGTALLLQAVAARPDHELRVSVVTGAPEAFAWARWLPHTEAPDGTVRIGPSPADVAASSATHPDHLVLVDLDTGSGTAIEPRPGRCVVRLGAATEDTATWVELSPDGGITVTVGDVSQTGRADLVEPGFAESVARALCARRRSDRAGGRNNGSGLSTAVLGVESVDDLDPAQVWATRATADLLTVVVGRDADGDELRLDLKESGHGGTGPHGLLVGATGSGKSELLRSIVLGLAAGHHPDDLAFVLVDYKGGATFSGLERLPHVAGVVTNLGDDLGLVDRMHTTLLGEIARRQQVLHDAGRLADIYAYRAARAEDDALPPLPFLVVVVDEFAELLTATPDLLDLFTTIGRIGRSIGVHQLLASQRLDDGRLRGLESFLSYRFALRTFTAEESRAVIGSALAAELPAVPGTGYLRTIDLVRFQAAYVSGPEDTGRPRGPETVRLVEWTAGPRSSSAAGTVTRRTLLDAAVDRMAGAASPTRTVWLPPLPERLTSADLAGFEPPAPYVARIGLLDLPARQRVVPLDLDLRRGDCHVAVLGGPDSGRSATLRTVVLALARQHTPSELVVHGVDLDGDSLRPLTGLPHVGSVAGRREGDLTRRILREAVRTIDRRADAGRPVGPRMLILVDGYTTLKAADDLHEAVVAIATRGADLGVHLLLTASRWHDLRPALQAAVHSRVELRLADPMDSVVDRRMAAHIAAAGPGRALVAGGHPAQLLAPGDGGVEAECHRPIAAQHTGRARPVRLLPTDLRLVDLPDGAVLPGRGAWWLGVGDDDLAPVALTSETRHLLVLGDRRSGRTSLLASMVQQRLRDPACVVALVDPRRTLIDLVPSGRVVAYATNAQAAQDLVRSLAAELASRADRLSMVATGTRSPGSEILLVVDDAELVLGGMNPLTPLEPYLAVAADIGFDLVVARHSGGAARALYDPVLQRMKELGCPGVLLSGDPEEGPLWPAATMRPLPPGRAVLARRGHAPVLVHLARP